jgi:hypothetical protein
MANSGRRRSRPVQPSGESNPTSEAPRDDRSTVFLNMIQKYVIAYMSVVAPLACCETWMLLQKYAFPAFSAFFMLQC